MIAVIIVAAIILTVGVTAAARAAIRRAHDRQLPVLTDREAENNLRPGVHIDTAPHTHNSANKP